MKKCILMCAVMAMTLTATAQNTWEEPEKKEEKVAVVKTNPMEKYLKGAVPEVNGKVTFTKTFDAPGKTAFQIYNILGKYLQGVTREPQQINSQLIKADTATYESAKEVVEYADNVAAYMDLKAGRIDALVVDSVVGYYIIAHN